MFSNNRYTMFWPSSVRWRSTRACYALSGYCVGVARCDWHTRHACDLYPVSMVDFQFFWFQQNKIQSKPSKQYDAHLQHRPHLPPLQPWPSDLRRPRSNAHIITHSHLSAPILFQLKLDGHGYARAMWGLCCRCASYCLLGLDCILFCWNQKIEN